MSEPSPQTVAEEGSRTHKVPLRADSEEKLERLMRTVGPQVAGVLRQRFRGVLDASDVEDVLSISLHRVWRGRAVFDPERGSLRAWFFRIAHHVALDVLKSGWHKARQMETPMMSTESHAPEEAADTDTDHPTPTNAALRAAIEALPEIQQRIVWADALGAGAVASAADLGVEFGIPAGTVRVYRKRALDRIRRALAGQDLETDSNS